MTSQMDVKQGAPPQSNPVSQAADSVETSVPKKRSRWSRMNFKYLKLALLVAIGVYLEYDAINPFSDTFDVSVLAIVFAQVYLQVSLTRSRGPAPVDYIIEKTSETKELLKKTNDEIKTTMNCIDQTIRARRRRSWEWVVLSSVAFTLFYFAHWRGSEESWLMASLKSVVGIFGIWLGWKTIYSFYTMKQKRQSNKLRELKQKAVLKFEEFQKMTCFSATAGVLNEFKEVMAPRGGASPHPPGRDQAVRPTPPRIVTEQPSPRDTIVKGNGHAPIVTQQQQQQQPNRLGTSRKRQPSRSPSPAPSSTDGERVGLFTRLIAALCDVDLDDTTNADARLIEREYRKIESKIDQIETTDEEEPGSATEDAKSQEAGREDDE